MDIFMYRGTIFGHSTQRCLNGLRMVEITLGCLSDERKMPIRLTAYGEMAEYINTLEWTDDEERYLTNEYHYDSLFELRYILIRNADREIAKVIVSEDTSENIPFRIFGQTDHITDANPAPLNAQELNEWYSFKNSLFNHSHTFITRLYSWSLDYGHYRTGAYVRTEKGIVSAVSWQNAYDLVWAQRGNDFAYNLCVDEISVDDLSSGIALAL